MYTADEFLQIVLGNRFEDVSGNDDDIHEDPEFPLQMVNVTTAHAASEGSSSDEDGINVIEKSGNKINKTVILKWQRIENNPL